MDVAQIVALANGLLAIASFFAMQWAIPRVGRPLSTIILIGSVLAFFYGGAYVWLAFNIEQVLAWSNVLRWVSLLVWPIVWAAPSVAAAVYVKRNTAIVQRLTEDLKSKIEQDRLEYH